MKKSLLVIILFVLCLPLGAQAPAFEELEFEADSAKTAYKPSGKNYAFLRSKRGTSGLNKTATADAITSAEVTEIVLVFSELDPSAIAEREEANRERWENLLKTYPEYFQYSTTYKSFCQCNDRGDSAAFKKAQGFYVYVNGEVPKVEEPKADPPPVAKTEPPAPAAPKTAAPASKPAKTEEKPVVETQAAVVDKTAVKAKEAPPAPEPVKEKEPEPAASQAEESHAASSEAAEPKESKRKPAARPKARKAKDPKACRPACYEGGDEDLAAFFKSSISLTKKQKRKAKNWSAAVKIQLDATGAIKKTMVTGESDSFNKLVEDALKSMNGWNAAVKNGTAIKSEVKFTLKFDKESKAMKPFDMLVNPKPNPKCKCMSDSEMFGD